MRNTTPIVATLFLAVFALVLILQPSGNHHPPGDPQPTSTTKTAPPAQEPTPPAEMPLSLLAKPPQWENLNKFQHTITRGDFEHLLTNIFTTDDTWKNYITLTDETAEILTFNDPASTPFTLRFATPEKTVPVPHTWKDAASLTSATPEKPLRGLHIAIDPGHIGGKWARMEERWFQIGQGTPVTEGDMTLRVAQLLAPLLRNLGAKVDLVRSKPEPITPLRPADLEPLADSTTRSDPEALRRFTEKLFYRTAEIRARAELINNTIKPDLVLCLHFNGAAWGDPANPTLVPATHFHILVHGAYTPDEVHLADQRYALLEKLLQRSHSEEVAVSKTVAQVFAEISKLPPYKYPEGGTNFQPIPGSPYLYARNLLANRLYNCPVIFMEPYIMNSTIDYARIQAGEYRGLRVINGVPLPSIYREYATALAAGLAKHYKSAIK